MAYYDSERMPVTATLNDDLAARLQTAQTTSADRLLIDLGFEITGALTGGPGEAW